MIMYCFSSACGDIYEHIFKYTLEVRESVSAMYYILYLHVQYVVL